MIRHKASPPRIARRLFEGMLSRLFLKKFYNHSIDCSLGEPKAKFLHVNAIAHELGLFFDCEDCSWSGTIWCCTSSRGSAKGLRINAVLQSNLAHTPLHLPAGSLCL